MNRDGLTATGMLLETVPTQVTLLEVFEILCGKTVEKIATLHKHRDGLHEDALFGDAFACLRMASQGRFANRDGVQVHLGHF